MLSERDRLNNKIALVAVRPTTTADLDFVLAAENEAENSPYIFQWPREKHLASLNDADTGHLIVEAVEDRRPVGYAILAGRENPHRSLELMRYVITEKGRGFGKAALEEIKRVAFEQWDTNRLWLDVLDHNERAQAAYKAAGFQWEGVLREAYFMNGRYETIVIMSILRREYFGAKTQEA